MGKLYLMATLFLALVISACAPGGSSDAPIAVNDAWVRAATTMHSSGQSAMATPGSSQIQGMGAVSAAYMILKNKSANPDRLLRVESDVAEAVELHTSEMTGEVMTMRPIESIDVPANGEAELKPGGMHVMLIGLKRDLKAGEVIPLVLVFEHAGRINVGAEVRQP